MTQESERAGFAQPEEERVKGDLVAVRNHLTGGHRDF